MFGHIIFFFLLVFGFYLMFPDFVVLWFVCLSWFFVILVVCLPVYLFSKGRMKGLGVGWMERWGGQQGVGERETMIRIHAMGENFQ